VKEKIEGFFEICRARGLTGTQGVLIPIQNVPDLMLKPEVVEAVAAGQFHVYAVSTVDEGIELLTGVPAGKPDATGAYPPGSINYLVERRFAELAERLRESLPFYANGMVTSVQTAAPEVGDISGEELRPEA
jgi:predicted ATP-dependent protease